MSYFNLSESINESMQCSNALVCTTPTVNHQNRLIGARVPRKPSFVTRQCVSMLLGQQDIVMDNVS